MRSSSRDMIRDREYNPSRRQSDYGHERRRQTTSQYARSRSPGRYGESDRSRRHSDYSERRYSPRSRSRERRY
jgi:hypothetical protein